MNSLIKKYNQEHLISFINEINEKEKAHLLNQINSIDFDLINKLSNNLTITKKEYEFKAMKSYETNEEYYNEGLNSFKKGEYALVTMAGGQGTRLGHIGPKGTFKIAGKSLFELQCDKLKNIYNKTNIYTPWYIMTSKDNNEDTIKHFKENNYFNYPKDKITFFTQSELPMIDENKKIIMDSKHNIKMGANGSGGVFEALSKNNIIKEMKERNIKWIFIGGIDNPLLPVDNPDLVGFSILNNYKVASKIIEKDYPEEKVGVFCYRNNTPSVIEYIEMTEEMNNQKDEKGKLIYKDSHILMNLFNIEILNNIADKSLNYIAAHKKTDYINKEGKLITPNNPNSYKFEMFIFDSFSYVKDVGLLKGVREDIFAPVKNKEGIDSPETATKLYLNYIKKEKSDE